MRKPSATVVGLGLFGIGASLIASPATAAMDCGVAPTGGTLAQSGDYCQLVFDTPGDYVFTVPASANQLFALVVGAGAGATTDPNSNHEGYSGSAGKVHYKDMSDSINAPLTIHIGEGGLSGNDSSQSYGGDSNVVSPSTSNYAISFGASGTQTGYSSACNVPDWTGGVLSVGEGARTHDNLAATAQACEAGQGEGVNPSLGDVDSEGTAVPAIFEDLDRTFGTGGQLWGTAIDTPFGELQPGDGAGVQVYVQGTTFDVIQSRAGGGIAYLRWRHVASLANTGSNSAETAGWAAGLMTLGLGLVTVARARRRVQR